MSTGFRELRVRELCWVRRLSVQFSQVTAESANKALATVFKKQG